MPRGANKDGLFEIMRVISRIFNVLHGMGCVKSFIFSPFLVIHGACECHIENLFIYYLL